MRSLTLGGIVLYLTLFLDAGGPSTTAQDRPSSDPTTPVEVGSFVDNSQGLRMSPYGFAVEDTLLYSADGGSSGESAGIRTNGLRVYDVSDPTSPGR